MSNTFENVVIIVSNLAFLLPAFQCLFTKRFLESFIWFGVFFTSTLYHACKFSPFDFPDPAGICFVLTYNQYALLDLFFAINTVPPLFLSFTSFDVTVYDVADLDVARAGDEDATEEDFFRRDEPRCFKWRGCDCFCYDYELPFFKSTCAPTCSCAWYWKGKRSVLASDKKAMRRFVFENFFGRLDDYRYGEVPYSPYPVERLGSVGISINPKPVVVSAKKTKRSSAVGDGSSIDLPVLKTNMVGMETLYIAFYAYIVGAALLVDGSPGGYWYSIFVVSCLVTVILWNAHFFFRYDGMLPNFDCLYLVLGLVTGALAISMMIAQNSLPSSAYWATHSIWHVAAGFARWFLLKSKYRFCCFY